MGEAELAELRQVYEIPPDVILRLPESGMSISASKRERVILIAILSRLEIPPSSFSSMDIDTIGLSQWPITAKCVLDYYLHILVMKKCDFQDS